VIDSETKPRPPCEHTDLLAAAEWAALDALPGGAVQTDLLALLRAEADDCHRCAWPLTCRLAAEAEACADVVLVLSWVAIDYWRTPVAAIGRDSAYGTALWAVERRLAEALDAGTDRADLPAVRDRALRDQMQSRTTAVRTQILEELLALVRVGRRLPAGGAPSGGSAPSAPGLG
jgi:hypothetical protein